MVRFSTLNIFMIFSLFWIVACSGHDIDLSRHLIEETPSDNASMLEPNSLVDLRADVNRNGSVEFDNDEDDQNEDIWDSSTGAIFLANIDDDEQKCPKDINIADVELATCNDAANEVIDGKDDLLDLAPLKIKSWSNAPAEAIGIISVSQPGADYVRLFKKQENDEFTVFYPSQDKITSDDLRRGIDLALEGKDIIRDKDQWDGFINITFRVEINNRVIGEDMVRMRLAPILTSHHLSPVETVYATAFQGSIFTANAVFRADLKKATQAANVPNGLEELIIPVTPPGGALGSQMFDQWTQDYFETGYMSMPALGGEQHVIRVVYRTSSRTWQTPIPEAHPLRLAGKIVFTQFRGKDVAGVQEFSENFIAEMDSLNSFGNTETIPPYSWNGKNYPFGRLFRGITDTFYPDVNMTKLLESQGMQPPLYVDTSWLFVGHVDETISFVKANSPRGWALLVNDPRLAKTMLEKQVQQGNGKTKMFIGKDLIKLIGSTGKWETQAAETTIEGVLDDPDIMSASERAAVKIDAQREILKQETGITDQEIVPIPFLHMEFGGMSVAYQPGTINGIYLSDTHFAAPDPHGPMIDGKDLFKTQLEQALGVLGINVDWVENWDDYHNYAGEVHCGSNAMRQVPKEKWWEAVF